MSAPNYFMDRLEKLRDLAVTWPEFVPKSGTFTRIEIFPDDTGRGLGPAELPALCFSPGEEILSPYSTARSEMTMVVKVSVFAYVNPNGKPADETRQALDRIAKVNRFLFSKKRVEGFWWRIEPSGGEFLHWTYTALSDSETGKTAIRVSADLRLAVAKLDLTA